MERRDFLKSVSGDRGGRLPCRHLCYDRLVTGETKTLADGTPSDIVTASNQNSPKP
jgi:hypothetical protein